VWTGLNELDLLRLRCSPKYLFGIYFTKSIDFPSTFYFNEVTFPGDIYFLLEKKTELHINMFLSFAPNLVKIIDENVVFYA